MPTPGRLESLVRERENRITELEETVNTCNTHIQDIERTLQEKEVRLQELNRVVQGSETYIADLKNTLNDRDIRLMELKKATLENENVIARFEEQIRQKNFYISRMEIAKANIERALRERETALNRIYNSNGWKGLLLYYRIRDRILPPYTKRRSVINSAVGGFRKLLKKSAPAGPTFDECIITTESASGARFLRRRREAHTKPGRSGLSQE